MLKTTGLVLGLLACTGCSAATYFFVTGGIINTAVLTGLGGLLLNLGNITQLVRGLTGGG